MSRKQKILVVDDFPENIELIRSFFVKEPYVIEGVISGEEALAEVHKSPPDLILLDVIMPGIDGFEVCSQIKNNVQTRLIPVIMITALNDSQSKIRGLELGVEDFATKPINLLELKARISSLLRMKRYIDELENAEKIIFSLALAVEAKDQYTLGHCNRLANYGTMLGEKLKLDESDISTIRRGSVLHDIGKIAISEKILLKPGPLNEEEFALIKEHPIIGERICQPLKALQPALPIIRSHQERFNGKGYPDGLSGKEIPLLAQIVALVDCFDALTTTRPYRKSLNKEEAFRVIQQETDDGFWDPYLVRKLNLVLSQQNLEERANRNILNQYE